MHERGVVGGLHASIWLFDVGGFGWHGQEWWAFYFLLVLMAMHAQLLQLAGTVESSSVWLLLLLSKADGLIG